MLMSQLNMKCGECSIIDYCNTYEETAPCEQQRFKNFKVEDFLMVTDYLENIYVEDIHVQEDEE